jgi:hypothetical protein
MNQTRLSTSTNTSSIWLAQPGDFELNTETKNGSNKFLSHPIKTEIYESNLGAIALFTNHFKNGFLTEEKF